VKLDIAMATAELAPYAKVGGLGDVIAALAKELDRQGHYVTVFLPRYRSVLAKEPRLQLTRVGQAEVSLGGRREWASYDVALLPETGVRIVLVGHEGYFGRDGVYNDARSGRDFPDNDERFIFFCKAVLEGLEILESSPDVLHLNDHQTAVAAPMLRESLRGRESARSIGLVFAIHNLGYQGIYPHDTIRLTGLDPKLAEPMGPLEFYGHLNLMKAGIIYADRVATVSPRYAAEIQSSAEHGRGLEGVLRARGKDLVGILNGVDVEMWDPTTDRLLPANYSSNDLAGKKENKTRLLESAELPVEPDVPIIGMISRLVEQKGFDLLEAAAHELLQERMKLIVLGKGERRYEELMRRLRTRYRQKFSVSLEFNDPMAHLIEAGSDFFLMPSRYEPCGLNQMYSLRYGTIPIVRATGGLADTVREYDPETGRGNGFVFDEYSADAMLAAVRRGLAAHQKKRAWKKLVSEVMQIDHSWGHAAQQYVELYREVRAVRRG